MGVHDDDEEETEDQEPCGVVMCAGAAHANLSLAGLHHRQQILFQLFNPLCLFFFLGLELLLAFQVLGALQFGA